MAEPKHQSQPKGLNRDVGPFNIHWESADIEKNEVLTELGVLDRSSYSLSELRSLCGSTRGLIADVLAWAERQHRLKGLIEFACSDLEVSVDRLMQSRRAFLPQPLGLRAMTIAQAKNREFRGVVLLWPFEVRGQLEVQPSSSGFNPQPRSAYQQVAVFAAVCSMSG